jgi:hypothetical protein
VLHFGMAFSDLGLRVPHEALFYCCLMNKSAAPIVSWGGIPDALFARTRSAFLGHSNVVPTPFPNLARITGTTIAIIHRPFLGLIFGNAFIAFTPA